MQKKPTTANDNVPLGYNMPLGYKGIALKDSIVAPHVAPLALSTTYTALNPVLAVQNTKTPQRKKIDGQSPVFALLLLWLIVAAAIARFAGSEENNLLTSENIMIAASGFGLLSLWLASLARRRGAKISHSIGISGACISAAGLAWLYMSTNPITVVPEILVMGFAVTSLIFAKLWRTPFLLHLSLFTAIGWSSYVFMNAQISAFVWLFPALWSLQMYLAMNFHIKRTITLSIFSGVLWIGVNLFLLGAP